MPRPIDPEIGGNGASGVKRIVFPKKATAIQAERVSEGEREERAPRRTYCPLMRG